MSEQKVIASDRISYKVRIVEEDPQSNLLPPVVLAMVTGCAHICDFLTVAQARELANVLNAAADEVEALISRPSTFDEVVDEKMAGKKFIEVSSGTAA